MATVLISVSFNDHGGSFTTVNISWFSVKVIIVIYFIIILHFLLSAGQNEERQMSHFDLWLIDIIYSILKHNNYNVMMYYIIV